MRRVIAWGFLLLPFFLAAPARAEEPVDISAARSLEWNRVKKTYTALGDVRAKRGGAEIRAARVTASYQGSSGTDIKTLVAEGDVVVAVAPYTALGDHAVYDVATGDATLTGQSLRVETESEQLTAAEKIAYVRADNRVSAYGDAKVVKGAHTLRADRLDAFFERRADGKMITRRIAAEGHVSVKTPREVVTGAAGVYDVTTGQAELTGAVRIAQGDSFLEGTRATVDMKTGVSRLYGGKKAGGRVRGVFYPKSSGGITP